MKDSLLLGISRWMIPIPRLIWHRRISRSAQHLASSLDFMSVEHHRVRDFSVRELPRSGKPLPPNSIAGNLNLPLDRVHTILDDLEKHMTFLFRNEQGEVTWAYPVTVEKTPHHVALSTGEEIYAA
jgi:hypothetical protein